MSKVYITKKSIYAPIRFEARYAFLNEMFDMARRKIINQDKDCYSFVSNWIDENINGYDLELILNVESFTRFMANGKIIYEFDKLLLEALSITDINNVPCYSFTLPYSTFYIHLGEHSSIFDGVYIDRYSSTEIVSDNEDSIDFIFLYKDYAKKDVSLNQLCEEKINIVTLDISDPESIIKDVLEDEVMSSLYMQYLIAKERKMLDDEKTMHFLQREEAESSEISRLLPVIINLILYINSQRDDVIIDWGKDVPKNKILRLEQENNIGEKNNLEKGLKEAGYSKIRYVGRKFARSREANSLSNALESGKILSTHFRRGHFRNQHYGKNNALTKVIFISPTIVNEGGEIQGKIIEFNNKG